MDWQQLAALALVAVAALWLIRTQVLSPRGGGCGGCGGCPSATRPGAQPAAPGVSQIVQIDLNMPSARAGSDQVRGQ
jgi:hypothetical protein